MRATHKQDELQRVHRGMRRLLRRHFLKISIASAAAVLGIDGLVFFIQHYVHSLQVVQHLNPNVASVTWSPDSTRFAAANGSDTVATWTRDGAQVYSQQIPYQDDTTTITWSPDRKYLAVGGSRVRLLNAQNGKSVGSYTFAGSAIAWSPDSRRIAFGGAPGLIQIWGVESGRMQIAMQAYKGTENGSLTISSLAWSPDGKYIAALGPHSGDFASLWDTTTGKGTLLPFDMPFSQLIFDVIPTIAWSPDGMRIAAGYHDDEDLEGKVALWSLQKSTGTWQYNGSISAHRWIVKGIAWSPDSTRFATIGIDGNIHVWSASMKALLDTATASDPNAGYGGGFDLYSLDALAWSPDGKYLLAGDDIGQLWLWNLG